MHSKIFGSAAGVGVVLTGGGLDQVLGLLHLRELEPIHIFASVRSARQMGPCQFPGRTRSLCISTIPTAFSPKAARSIERFGKQVGM